MIKMNAQALRYGEPVTSEIKRNDIYIVVDSVYDLYNVGSIFRVADAVAANMVLCCGLSQFESGNTKIKRASINTTSVIDYKNFAVTEDAIDYLRKEIPNISIIGIEQSERAIDYRVQNYSGPIGLVVGNETSGVSKEVLDLCDGIVEIPTFGHNVSLNVHCALILVAYEVLRSKGN